MVKVDQYPVAPEIAGMLGLNLDVSRKIAAELVEHPSSKRPSMTFDSRAGIVTMADGRQVGIRVAKDGEPTFAVGADGTRYTLDGLAPHGQRG